MSRKKVMLVDDSSTVIMAEKMILGGGTYEVVVARDGMEALEKAPIERPDLILLDLVMPKLGGMETCQQLRQIEVTASTPIIMVTTRGEESYIEAALAAGCDDYITKPINGIELLTKIRSQLE